MNKSVSNSSPSVVDFEENFLEKITENIGQQEPVASKRASQLNTLSLLRTRQPGCGSRNIEQPADRLRSLVTVKSCEMDVEDVVTVYLLSRNK